MEIEEAKDLLSNISAYDIDGKRGKDKQEAIKLAIRSLESWQNVEEEIDTYLWTEGFGNEYRNDIRNIIRKALAEVKE